MPANAPVGLPPVGAPVGLPPIGVGLSNLSCQPDPDGFDVPASFSSSLQVGQSHYEGYSAELFGHNG